MWLSYTSQFSKSFFYELNKTHHIERTKNLIFLSIKHSEPNSPNQKSLNKNVVQIVISKSPSWISPFQCLLVSWRWHWNLPQEGGLSWVSSILRSFLRQIWCSWWGSPTSQYSDLLGFIFVCFLTMGCYLLAAPSWEWAHPHSLPQLSSTGGFCLLGSNYLGPLGPSHSFSLGMAKITFTGLCILFLLAYNHQQHELLCIHYIKGIFFLEYPVCYILKDQQYLGQKKSVHLLLWITFSADKKLQITTSSKAFINLNYFFLKSQLIIKILFWHQIPFFWSVLIFLHYQQQLISFWLCINHFGTTLKFRIRICYYIFILSSHSMAEKECLIIEVHLIPFKMNSCSTLQWFIFNSHVMVA